MEKIKKFLRTHERFIKTFFEGLFGYLALNIRTGKYAYMYGNFIRNAEIFELIEIN